MYNEQSMKVATKILSSKGATEEFIKLLEEMKTPVVYSGEDFDRRQALATLLTKLGEV